MKIPKYIDEALKKRTKSAQEFNKYDIIISKWIDSKGLDEVIDSSDFHGGVESVVHPEESERCIRESILSYRKWGIDVIDIDLSILEELAELQIRYQRLVDNQELSKKKMCELVIPFRDRYGLSDKEALSIARGELGIAETFGLLQKESEE